MKILYLTDQFYLHGGIEKMLAQKINNWKRIYGYDVVLCTSEHRNNDFVYPLEAGLKHVDLNIDYHRSKSYFHPLNLIKSWRHFTRLRRLVKKEKPDVIVSANYTPEQFFIPFISRRIPKVKEFHSSGAAVKAPVTFFDKLKYQLFLLFGRYQALVVLNEDEKKYYPFKNLHVIPNFIEKDKISDPSKRGKIIIAAGRIAPVKQFDHLIKAWSLIAGGLPDWSVKIFGDGDDVLSNQLQALIRQLKVPSISLMGPTSNLPAEMEKASIYAMTSATECFPMVLLEAQASGLPIVSYDCPNGPGNIINADIDGMLTPHNNIEVFSRELKRLAEDEQTREAMSLASKHSIGRFSSENIMNQWNELFLTLQNRRYV